MNGRMTTRPGPALRAALIVALLAALLLMLLPSTSWALGLGLNLGYAYRIGTLGAEDTALSTNNSYPDLDFSSNDLNVGLTLDTAVARDRLFNYRLNVDYVRGWIDPDTVPGLSPNAETTSDGVDLENIFGFGVVRRPDLRWWVGPSLRISIARALSVDSGAAQYFASPLVNVGAGIVTGVNLHRGRHVSAGMTLGYDINFAVYAFDAPIDIQYTGALHRVTLGVTVLYRFGSDAFGRPAPIASRR